MNNKIYHVLFISSVALLSSCKIMYIPNMHNVPLFKQKGDVRATVGASDFQAAYAVSNKIGVIANAQFKGSEWSISSGNYETKFETKKNAFEAGLGYYKPLGEKGVFEVYGGGGIGALKWNRTEIDSGISMPVSKYSTSTTRFFLQPVIGMGDENFGFAFSTRLMGVKFGSVDTVNYSMQDLIDDEINGLDAPMFMFFEPALTFRVGWKYVKFHTQMIYSIKTNPEPLSYIPFVWNFGIHLTIPGKGE